MGKGRVPGDRSQTASLLTTVTGPGTLSFWWKVSSEPGADVLRFYLNGSKQVEISGETEWARLSYELPAGSQALEWRYKKGSSGAAGLDRGFVDLVAFGVAPVALATPPASQAVDAGATVTLAVAATGAAPLTFQWRFNGDDLVDGPGVRGANTASLVLSNVPLARAGAYTVVVGNPAGSLLSPPALLTIAPGQPLGEALDAPNLVWTTTGSPAWSGQSLVTHDGEDAARSGAIPDSGTSTLQTTVTGPGTLSFWWKVSSEPANDKLRFYLAGTQQENITGETDWTWRSYALPAGSQPLEWRYTKNSSLTAGQDRGWVDQVLYQPGNVPSAPVIGVPPASVTAVSPSTVTFRVAAVGSGPLGYQWRHLGLTNAQYPTPDLLVPNNLVNGGGTSGATTTNLTLANAGPAQAGFYSVVVSNAVGRATSAPAYLTLIMAPAITQQIGRASCRERV